MQPREGKLFWKVAFNCSWEKELLSHEELQISKKEVKLFSCRTANRCRSA